MSMLDTLELVKRTDGGSDVDVVDLLDYLKIPDGWVAAATDGDAPVDEALTLNVDAGSIDALATFMQSIDLKVKEIANARRPAETLGVWLRAQLTGETNARQAYLLRGKRGNQIRVSSPAITSNALLQYPLGLTRMAGWETTTALQIPASPANVSAHGGTVAYSLPGDLNGRIALTKITPGDGYSSFNEFWIGVKSEQYGGVTPANFVPFWGIDKRGYTGADTTEHTDANAVCGKNLQITFATTTAMTSRCVIPVNLVTANVADQRGRYLVLVRCYADDSSLVVNVRGGSGYMYSTVPRTATFAYGAPLQLSTFSGGYRYYVLGEFELPPINSVPSMDMNLASLALQAEKVSGTGMLIVDGLLLIPAEHFVHVATAQLLSNSAPHRLYVITTPDMRYKSVVSITSGSEYILEQNPPDQLTWLLPAGDGVIVCAGSSNTGRVADVLEPIFSVYPSYATLRGAT